MPQLVVINELTATTPGIGATITHQLDGLELGSAYNWGTHN